MIKVTITNDEGGIERAYRVALQSGATWTSIIEDAVIPILRGLTYRLPETDDLMEAIEGVEK